MNPKQKAELVNALLACPTMGNRHMRDAVVDDLPDDIKNNISRNSADRVDVANIVKRCLNYADGIKELIEIVRIYEGDSIPMQKVDETIANIYCLHIVSDELRAGVFSKASRVTLSRDELIKLYRASLPPGFSVRDEAETLWSVLDHLWDIPRQPNNRFPVFEFVERLAFHTINQDVASELRSMTGQMAPYLNLQQADINRIRARIEAEATPTQMSPPYLLVEVSPDPNNRNRDKEKLFSVYISFWKHRNDTRYLHTDETPRPIKSIPPLLEQILTAFANDFPEEMPDLTIEFFLPRELISCEVDQWVKQDVFLGEIKLGADHRVVVRSWERATNPTLQGYWLKKWRQFQTLAKIASAQNMVRICNRRTHEPRRLYNDLIGSEHTICLGLTFMPTDHPSEGRLLSEILRAGMPIALWPRPCDDVSRYTRGIRAKIRALVSSENLSDLPRLIQAERQQAIDSTHPGNYLTLLWDDPYRLPLKLNPKSNTRLQTP